MKIWTTSMAPCPFCGLESTHSKNCRWVMTLEQLFRSVRNNKADFLRRGHHEQGDTLRCLADLLDMHPFDAQGDVFKGPPQAAAAPMPTAQIVGEIFSKNEIPSSEAAARNALAAMRYARDFEPEKWDALMTTEAGVMLTKAWDVLKAAMERKPK